MVVVAVVVVVSCKQRVVFALSLTKATCIIAAIVSKTNVVKKSTGSSYILIVKSGSARKGSTLCAKEYGSNRLQILFP